MDCHAGLLRLFKYLFTSYLTAVQAKSNSTAMVKPPLTMLNRVRILAAEFSYMDAHLAAPS